MAHSPVTVQHLLAKKKHRQRITMLTAYDATFASLFDKAGIDVLLVGDSLGMVVQGNKNTLPVTLEDMIYHSRCVARVTQRAHIVADLPFMTYQISPKQALLSAGKLIQHGHAHSVKIEGGQSVVEHIRKISQAGIPVMGHLGLTPQSIHALGGYRVQGRESHDAERIQADALLLEEAGCYAIVLEAIPSTLAASISEHLTIPTIGIGAGPHCDGQVLVYSDMLGLDPDFRPKFVRAFAELHENVTQATHAYIQATQDGTFPGPEHCYATQNLRLIKALNSD